MSRFGLLGILLVLALTLTACNTQTVDIPDDPPVVVSEDVSAAEAQTLITSNEGDSDFVILDLRTAEEYGGGHIADAVNLDYYGATFSSQLDGLEKTKTYLIYCGVGGRSSNTKTAMQGFGFSTVYNLTGGITEWQAQGYVVVID
ncbi:MAG: rhodanese-like domain-containing protein [bacterium]